MGESVIDIIYNIYLTWVMNEVYKSSWVFKYFLNIKKLT